VKILFGVQVSKCVAFLYFGVSFLSCNTESGGRKIKKGNMKVLKNVVLYVFQ